VQQQPLDRWWQNVLRDLESSMPYATFAMFAAPTRLVDLAAGVATIELANTRGKEWVENRLSHQFKRLLSVETHVPVHIVRIVLRGD
jgi:chromosomal replication initiation ATPase DnaA